jgi:hypothetical protein
LLVELDENAVFDPLCEHLLTFGCGAIAPVHLIGFAQLDALVDPMLDGRIEIIRLGIVELGGGRTDGRGGHVATPFGWPANHPDYHGQVLSCQRMNRISGRL